MPTLFLQNKESRLIKLGGFGHFDHMTVELSHFYLRYALSILWKESRLKCVATLSWHLNTGGTLCEQHRELRSKCSEIEKGGGRNFLNSRFMW
jgi:hypothetical protein